MRHNLYVSYASVTWLLAALISGFILLGFFLHTSSSDANDVFGKYTLSYLSGLAVISLLWLCFLWWTWIRRAHLMNYAAVFMIVSVITALLAMLVLPVAYIFLHNRSLDENLFTPIDEKAHAFFQFESSPEPRLPSDSNSLRVLTLGGSTTYGSRLDRDKTYPAVLEKILRQRFPDKPIEVLNAGVSWHTSMHSLLRYVSRFAYWKPHVVIVMHAFNDIFQASEGRLTTGRYRDDYGHFFGALGRRVNPRDHFRDKLISQINNNWLARTWYSDLRRIGVESDKGSVDLLRAEPSFRRNLKALIDRASRDGAQVVVANQPFLYRSDMSNEERANLIYGFYYRDYATIPSTEEQTTAMISFNQAAREVAEQSHALFIDLESALPKTFQFMSDDVHYTVLGARRVAQIVSDALPWTSIIRRTLVAP